MFNLIVPKPEFPMTQAGVMDGMGRRWGGEIRDERRGIREILEE